MPTQIIITFQVHADKLTAFKKILDEVKDSLPKIRGCLGLEIFEGYEPNSFFTLIETWESQSLHQQHVQNLIQSGAWDNLKAHLTDEPLSGYYTKRS